MTRTLLIICLLSSFSLHSQSILTRGEVYDFNIGDEFQYSFDNYPGTMVERYTVLDKEFSQNNDTVFYTLSESYYSNGPDGIGGTEHNFSDDTISYYITSLNSLITPFGDSSEIHDIYLDSTYFYYPDTIIEFDSNLCGLEVNGWDSYPPVFESNQRIFIYGKGVGPVWSYHYDPSSPMPYLQDRKLYYYKKGNTTCGSPVTVSTESINLNNTNVNIYPVPANHKVNVELESDGEIENLQLIDMTGKSISINTEKNFENKYSFDSTDIPDGIYFIHFRTNNNSVKRRLIIAH